MIHVSKVNLTGSFQLSMDGQNVTQIVNSGSTPVDLKCVKADGSESTVTLKNGFMDQNERIKADAFQPSDELESIEIA